MMARLPFGLAGPALLALLLLGSCGGGGGGRPVGPGPLHQTCVAPERPTGEATVAVEAVFAVPTGIREPTKYLQPPGDPSKWFVLEKGGQIKVIDVADPANVRVFANLGDRVLSNNEAGLIGFAFHPRYPAVPEMFVYYTTQGTAPGIPLVSRLSRLVLDDAVAPSTFTEQVLISVDQPSMNHHGGDLAFGADGYLYVGLGDGEPPHGLRPPPTRALAGAMLRIDVVDVPYPEPGYAIPPDNPFAGNPRCGPGMNALPCPEIHAWGFRNPWRWSFDDETGRLWLADVGEYTWEEVNVIERGRDYGWPCREGLHPHEAGPDCPTDALDPVVEYDHSQGDTSVTGGFVYRGSAMPALRGRYVFADYTSGRIFALREDGTGGHVMETLVDTDMFITSFATGADGELYFAPNGFPSAGLQKLVPATGSGPVDTIPANLADTGCVDPASPSEAAPTLIPYDVNASFWSDDADKARYLALPDDATMTIDPVTGHWELPPGSVLLKRFKLADRLVETRLMMRHPDGVWAGYTYRWNAAGTEATRVVGGATGEFDAQTWIYPSEGECMRCHTPVAGFSLGLTTAQLNRLHDDGSGTPANQLATLDGQGLLSPPLGAEPDTLPALPDPADGSSSLAERARAYLDANCSQCHQPGGPTPSSMDLRFTTPLAAAGICDVAPAGNDLGLDDARLVAPGDPARSVLLARMSRRDSYQMPPVGSNLVDAAGASLLGDWIDGLANCD